MSTYSQIYIQTIFAVQHRNSQIHQDWEDRLYQYITGIVREQKQKMLAINGMPDHIHILIGMKPACCLSDLVREIKKSTSDWIKEQRLTRNKFNWQEGFGAFSYSHSQLDDVIAYIQKQKEHHRNKTFKEEYVQFLKKFNVDYDERYLFDWLE